MKRKELSSSIVTVGYEVRDMKFLVDRAANQTHKINIKYSLSYPKNRILQHTIAKAE
jgi:hypothetical protein